MQPPGFSVPLASASRTIHSAARSLTEAPGLANSHLPQISQPAASLGPLSRTIGVLPIRSSALPRGAGAVMRAGLKPLAEARNANALAQSEISLPRRS